MSQHLKLNKKAKKVWTTALRSGEYSQGHGTLVRGEDDFIEHCCLGVLYHCVTGRQPNRGMDELGRKMLKRVNMTNDTQQDLACMNDNDGKNFKQIANWIDKNL